MEGQNTALLKDIREMMKVIADGQTELRNLVKELKADQKKLYDEIRIYNSVINNIPIRTELIN